MKMLKRSLAILLMLTMLLGVMPISASAANSYWGYEDYDTIVQPDAPAEITSYPTTITKNSNSLYTITCTTDAGKLAITLVEETWGTFNLGSWKLTDNNGKTHTFVDGSTDMEYVHQYYYSDSEVTWSGGNHGGEALVSLNFYDGETGNEISLSNGGSKTVNVLHIIEKTELLHFPDDNNDSINDYTNKNTAYTKDQVYAQLTRKYTITGPQIKLNVDYLYTKDSYHARNYSCMFPINKTYGRYCDMIDKNGTIIDTIVTVPYGDKTYPVYTGPNNSGNEATRAIVYSTDYPQYQFDMRVNTFKDSLNEFKDASYKTSFWDMNHYYNKLYFTRFDQGLKILHEKGKEVHTECVWTFRYVNSGRQPSLEEEIPVSRGKGYTNNVNAGDSENTFYGASLTDGIAAESFSYEDNSWYCFSAYSTNVSNNIGTTVIDLHAKYDISKVRIHLANVSSMSVTAPTEIRVYASNDANNISNLIATVATNSGGDAIYWTEAETTDTEAYQYVKFEFALSCNFAYVNEIEIYGIDVNADRVIAEGPEDNLASGRDYIISKTNKPIVSPEYNVDYSASLTDGKASAEFNAGNGSWFTFQKGTNTNGEIGSITVNFDKICEITKLRLHLANAANSMLVNPPSAIKVYGSTDGVNYSLIGEMPIDTSNEIVYWSNLEVENAKAGSVRFEFTLNGGYAYVNEIEVHGTETDEDFVAAEVHTHNYNGDWVSDKNNHWQECSCGQAGNKATHTEGEWVTEGESRILRCAVCGYIMDIKETTGDPENPPTPDDYVLGDINNNGSVDMTDYILAKRAYFGTYNLTEDEFKRGNVNFNEGMDMTDYILIKRVYFGTYSF